MSSDLRTISLIQPFRFCHGFSVFSLTLKESAIGSRQFYFICWGDLEFFVVGCSCNAENKIEDEFLEDVHKVILLLVNGLSSRHVVLHY